MFNRTSLFRVLVEVGSSAEIPAVKERVIALMEERHGEKDVTVLTQDAVLSTFSNIFSLLTAALAGIAAISLTVAGIGIMNVMLVSVSERTREIGLLKALGVTARQVLAVFLVEAAVTTGGLAGLAVGGAGRSSGRLSDFPAEPPVWRGGARFRLLGILRARPQGGASTGGRAHEAAADRPACRACPHQRTGVRHRQRSPHAGT
jgi:putative ABC transport system permease protein